MIYYESEVEVKEILTRDIDPTLSIEAPIRF